jgi:hypothetical protein
MFPRIRSFALITLCFAGCEAEEEDTGTPPSLESLMLSGDDVTVGAPSVVSGTLSFTDPDGDVDQAQIDVVQPDGTMLSTTTEITGAAGTTEGSIVVQLQVIANEAGTYEATLVLIDAMGNESEPLTTTFEVAG